MTKEDEVKIENFSILRPRDGDFIAVFIKGIYSEEQREKIRNDLIDSLLPHKVKVKIFNADLVELKVIRPEDNF